MKVFKIIAFNIILLLCAYLLFKYVSLAFLLKPESANLKQLFENTNKAFCEKNYETYYKKHKFVPPVIPENPNKKPVIIFGCSYAEGMSIRPLEYEEKFSYQLAKATSRPVYNRAFGGQGIQYTLYQLEDENTYKELPEPEYIVYVMIHDQISRLYRECCPWNKAVFYENKNGKLQKITNPLHYSYLATFLRTKKVVEYKHSDYLFMKEHLLYAKSLADKHWKNAKWILLLYDEQNVTQFDSLKDLGFTITTGAELIAPDFLINPKYYISEKDRHPTKYAWEDLTPKFVDKYINSVQK